MTDSPSPEQDDAGRCICDWGDNEPTRKQPCVTVPYCPIHGSAPSLPEQQQESTARVGMHANSHRESEKAATRPTPQGAAREESYELFGSGLHVPSVLPPPAPPDPTPQVQGQARAVEDVLFEWVGKQTKPPPLGRDEWGPTCAGCGADEYRIDGFCSCECRDRYEFAWEIREALARDTQVREEWPQIEGAPDCRPLRGIPSDTLRYELESRARSIASCQEPAQPDPEVPT